MTGQQRQIPKLLTLFTAASAVAWALARLLG